MTIFIIILTVVVSLACFKNPELNNRLILYPYLVKRKKQWYRLFTSGFQHADYVHLFVNMFVMFFFGSNTEHYYRFYFGNAAPYVFAVMYLTSIFAANLSTYYKEQDNVSYRALGASGAVSAVLFSFVLFEPLEPIYLYLVIKLPALVFGILYLVYSYYMGKRQYDNTNHEAHYYGAIYGMLFIIVLKPQVVSAFFAKIAAAF